MTTEMLSMGNRRNETESVSKRSDCFYADEPTVEWSLYIMSSFQTSLKIDGANA
jgi:hypothetical protein